MHKLGKQITQPNKDQYKTKITKGVEGSERSLKLSKGGGIAMVTHNDRNRPDGRSKDRTVTAPNT